MSELVAGPFTLEDGKTFSVRLVPTVQPFENIGAAEFGARAQKEGNLLTRGHLQAILKNKALLPKAWHQNKLVAWIESSYIVGFFWIEGIWLSHFGFEGEFKGVHKLLVLVDS